MSINLGTDVKKHTIDRDQQVYLGTETFTHEARGPSRLGVAVRYQVGDLDDAFLLQVKHRIPGRNSDDTKDDYYDDEVEWSAVIGGKDSPAGYKTYATDTPDQHVAIIGAFYNITEYAIDYLWKYKDSGESGIHGNSKILAITSWTHFGTGN